MIKKINIEEIKKREEFLYGKLLTRKEVEYALEEAKASVKRNMEYLDGKFPFSAAYNSEPFPSERDGMYPITENVEWTTGFWTGLIWLMYDWSREECFKELGMADVRSFKERVEKRINFNKPVHRIRRLRCLRQYSSSIYIHRQSYPLRYKQYRSRISL